MKVDSKIEELWKNRRQNKFLKWSLVLFILSSLWVWFFSGLEVSDFFSDRRLRNWRRFWLEDANPKAPNGLFAWVIEQLNMYGYKALASTLAIAIVATVLAGLTGLILSYNAASSIGATILKNRISFFVKGLCILLRALPEYILAFLLLAALGATAWPAIFALAIHNAGILGRLGGEVVENLPPRPLEALHNLGASKANMAVHAVVPMGMARYLLYFFYRFETCVREATIIGMLGVISIGYYVIEMRAQNQYDAMLFLMALSALLVLLADVVSDWSRKRCA